MFNSAVMTLGNRSASVEHFACVCVEERKRERASRLACGGPPFSLGKNDVLAFPLFAQAKTQLHCNAYMAVY